MFRGTFTVKSLVALAFFFFSCPLFGMEDSLQTAFSFALAHHSNDYFKAYTFLAEPPSALIDPEISTQTRQSALRELGKWARDNETKREEALHFLEKMSKANGVSEAAVDGIALMAVSYDAHRTMTVSDTLFQKVSPVLIQVLENNASKELARIRALQWIRVLGEARFPKLKEKLLPLTKSTKFPYFCLSAIYTIRHLNLGLSSTEKTALEQSLRSLKRAFQDQDPKTFIDSLLPKPPPPKKRADETSVPNFIAPTPEIAYPLCQVVFQANASQ